MMKSLKPHEKQLVLDYFLGLSEEQEKQSAQQLLAQDGRAAVMLAALKDSLGPLKTYHVEQCPDHLSQQTLEKLKNAKFASEARLSELLRQEQNRPVTTRQSFWRGFVEMAAAAAMIVAVAGVTFPTLQNARSKYWQTKCAAQLGSVANGINQYSADNWEMPTVATTANSPWWKIGDQGSENVSNTRHLWLLVKHGYTDPQDFVCPARTGGKALKFDTANAHLMSDFPARKYVTYSFRVVCNVNPTQMLRSEKILISDLNPVFEKIPEAGNGELNLKLCDMAKSSNSTNHRSRGQSILCGDGSVRFVKTRNVGPSNDDIFTIRGTETYKGCERPCSEDDDFLAP